MSREQIDLRTSLLKMKVAEARLVVIYRQLRPSHNLPITIKREGARWVCLMDTDPDILNCPVAYGSSPEQAMVNFDMMWNGVGIEIQQQQEDEEEPL